MILKKIFNASLLVSLTLLASCSSANDEPGEKKDPDASAVNTLSIADKEATAETKALYANLWVVLENTQNKDWKVWKKRKLS